MTLGWALITATFLLTVVGCVLYLNGTVGLAQFLWVLASGTAGAGVVSILEKRE